MSYYSQAGVSGLITNEDVLQYIKFLMREANNPRNDGWVQKGYRDKLTILRDELNTDYHSSQYSPYSGTWYPSSSTTPTGQQPSSSPSSYSPAVKVVPKTKGQLKTDSDDAKENKTKGTSGSD